MTKIKRFKSEKSSDGPGRGTMCGIPIIEEETKQDQDGNKFILNAETTEHILNQLDYSRQKICRLVCKSFNAEVCRLFASKGISIRLRSKQDARRFKEAYHRSQKMASSLPSPWTNASLVFEILFKDYLDCYNVPVECPIVGNVTTLKVYNCGKAATPAPPGYLELIAPSLVELDSTYWTPPPDFSKLYFPKLRLISIWAVYPQLAIWFGTALEEGYEEKQLAFWSSVIAAAPNLLQLKIKGEGLSKQLINCCNLTSVQALLLATSDDNSVQVALLRAMTTKMFNLTELVYYGQDMSDSGICQGINRVLIHFSNTLTRLLIGNGDRFWENFPFCPSLRQLKFSGRVDIQSFPWRNVPGLVSFSCESTQIVESLGQPENACVSVRRVGLQEFPCPLPSTLFQIFLNATHWRLTSVRFLEEFCLAAQSSNAQIYRLGLEPLYSEARGADARDFTPHLSHLTGLVELDLYEPWRPKSTPVSFVRDRVLAADIVRFDELPSLKTLRWRVPQDSMEVSPDFKNLPAHLSSLQHVELIGYDKPSWNDTFQDFLIKCPAAVRKSKALDIISNRWML